MPIKISNATIKCNECGEINIIPSDKKKIIKCKKCGKTLVAIK